MFYNMMGNILYGSNRTNQNNINYRKRGHGEYFVHLCINIFINNTNNLNFI